MKNQIIISLTIILTSCNYINTDKKRSDKVESSKDFFYKNQKDFDQLTKEILANENLNAKIGKTILAVDTDELISEKMQELRIESFSLLRTKCENLEIEYKTLWTKYPIGQLYLSKDSCVEDPLSGRGNYAKTGTFIETWGLGDGWTIWIDSDFM